MLNNPRSRSFLILGLVLICIAAYLGVRAKDGLRQKETVLKQTLYFMRASIDQYAQDKNAAPQSLDDLVRAGYWHDIPLDPTTNSSKTWKIDKAEMIPAVDQTAPGITDIHSGSDRISSEGTPYSSW